MKSKLFKVGGSIVAVLFVVVMIGLMGAYYLVTNRVEGSYFDSEGVRIHYTDESAGTPVVLLHGFAVNADLNWRLVGITKELAKSYRVLAMDLRGHGLSDKPHGETQYGAEMGEDVIRLLDHLEIEKAHIVGYSLGGFITLQLAVTHSERMLTASVLGAGWEDPVNASFMNALGKFADALESGKGIEPLSTYLGDDRVEPSFLHTLWVKTMTKYFNDHKALIAMIRGLPELALERDAVAGIPVPVCSIVGDQDPLLVSMKRMIDVVPDHTVTIIEGTDHMQTAGHVELLENLAGFLASHEVNTI